MPDSFENTPEEDAMYARVAKDASRRAVERTWAAGLPIGLHDIVSARALDDYKVAVTFDTGDTGIFDCIRYLSKPYWKPLNDKAFFKQVRVDYGTLVWPNEIDIGPEDVWEFADFAASTAAQKEEMQ